MGIGEAQKSAAEAPQAGGSAMPQADPTCPHTGLQRSEYVFSFNAEKEIKGESLSYGNVN